MFPDFLNQDVGSGQGTSFLSILVEQKGRQTADAKFYQELAIGSEFHLIKPESAFQFFGQSLNLRLQAAAETSTNPPDDHNAGNLVTQNLGLEFLCSHILHRPLRSILSSPILPRALRNR